MKKKFVFCLLFAVLLCVTAYAAGTFKPVVSRIGIKGTNLRMVVQTSSLPVGLTAAQLEGALMNGKMTYKASEEGKGDITVVNSEIVGFEPGASTSVLVVASNDYLNVNNVDDGTGKYDCDLTVTMKETDVNQRSFKVNFSRGGNSTYMRLVVPLSDIPADLTPAELKNTVISGTLTHNTDQSLNLEFNNTVVSVEFNDTEAVFNVADGETAKKANFTVGRAYTGTLTVKIHQGQI